MENFPTPITAENFDVAVSHITIASAKVKKKKLIKNLVRPIGSLLFIFLSVLLVYGACYKYSSPEELVLFEKLDFMTKLWTSFSEILTTANMAWYVYWLVLIGAAFIVPLAVSAIITALVSLCVREKKDPFSEGTEAEKAKALHSVAVDLSKSSSNDDNGIMKKVFKWSFVILVAALLVYAFLTLQIAFSVSMLLGFAVAALILYFVYSLIFNAFYALNRLFYKGKHINVVKETDEYWLKVDPEEKKRREEAAERAAREAEEARLRAERNREIAAEKRVRALAAERNSQYSVAKQLFKEAAELGDALAMDNYARHCLIGGNRSEAIRWLQKAVDTGEADNEAKTLLRALKDGQHINATYCD